MKNNIKILKFFVENKNKQFSIKSISDTLKINYRIVYEEVLNLKKENLIKIEKKGNNNLCTFDYNYNSNVLHVEEIRKNELFKNKDIFLIYKRIKEIKNPFYILLIFGSYSNKTATKSSDIDLCLITDNKNIKDSVQSILNITPVKVHFNEFTTNEFVSMLKEREENLGHQIVNNNIILYGIESFYELVKYVK